jgi:uncharacterized protein YeaO (DUF488 family)
VRIARVYDAPQPDDGQRVLVDRLWPRGVRKDDPRIDRWIKDAAPSTALRQWSRHDPERYDEFVARYEQELQEPHAAAALQQLRTVASTGPITLLTSSKDPEHGHLVVLRRLLQDDLSR